MNTQSDPQTQPNQTEEKSSPVPNTSPLTNPFLIDGDTPAPIDVSPDRPTPPPVEDKDLM